MSSRARSSACASSACRDSTSAATMASSGSITPAILETITPCFYIIRLTCNWAGSATCAAVGQKQRGSRVVQSAQKQGDFRRRHAASYLLAFSIHSLISNVPRPPFCPTAAARRFRELTSQPTSIQCATHPAQEDYQKPLLYQQVDRMIPCLLLGIVCSTAPQLSPEEAMHCQS